MDKGELDARLEIRVSRDLLARVDAARGISSRGAWVRREMERGLTRQDLGVEPEPRIGITQEMYGSPLLDAQLREPVREPFYEDGEMPDG